jgi:hypothetical protein
VPLVDPVEVAADPSRPCRLPSSQWEPPSIANPAYKGPWKAPMIDNPDYKGAWVHPMIPNPAYKEDATLPARCVDCGMVGFELWQVKAGTVFDDILVTDSLDEAKAVAQETFFKKKDGEAAMSVCTRALQDGGGGGGIFRGGGLLRARGLQRRGLRSARVRVGEGAVRALTPTPPAASFVGRQV